MRKLEGVEDKISDLKSSLEQVKVKQFISKQSIIGYKTNTDDDYDFVLTSDEAVKRYSLVFTHATARHGAIIRLSMYLSVTDSDVLANPIGYTGTAPPVSGKTFKVAPPGDTETEWVLAFINNSWGISNTVYTVWGKLFFDGTDTGTWDLTEL